MTRVFVAPALLMLMLVPACRSTAPVGDSAVAAVLHGLHPGDLLFQDTDSSPLCDAIRAVTQGRDGADFTHVAILASVGPDAEVVGTGVKVTPLDRFLARSTDDRGRPRVVVGRLKPEFTPAAAQAVERAMALLGSAYDDVFVLGDDRYYCSELVYVCYVDPASGAHLFQLAPMTFCAPGTGEPMEVWQRYYAEKAVPIPEGKPGCNPGGLSRCDKVVIVHTFGRPTGWPEHTYRRYLAGE